MPPKNQTTPKPPAKPKQNEKSRETKQYAPVSLNDLKPRKVTKEEKTTVLPGRERSAEQKAVDKVVRDLAYEYLDAGSPKQFRDMPVVAYTLTPEQAETVRFMISKACNLLNCKPKWGRTAWDDGKEVVTFCPIPRDPAQWTDRPTETDNEESSKAADADNTKDAAPGSQGQVGTAKTDPKEFEDSVA